MKNVYVCEKCGEQFKDYDACYACESSHSGIGSECQGQLIKFQTWNHGDIMPRTIAISSDYISSREQCGRDEHYEYGIYTFKRYLTDKEIADVKEEALVEEAKNKAYWEEYSRKREEEKARKAAEEQASKESAESAQEV